MRDHTEIEELLAVRALDGLDGDDEAHLDELMASHGDCDECRGLERGSAEAAAAMALALQPVTIPDGLEERTLARARAISPIGRGPGAVAPRRVERRTVGRPRERSPFRATAAVAAVAAAIVLFAGGWLLGSSTGRPGTSLEGTRVATFEGSAGADVVLLYRPGGTGMVVVGTGLDRPPAGRTYELWLFRGETPLRAGCFEPAEDGSVRAFVDASVGGSHTAAVTEERATCPSAPTTEPVLTAAL